MKAFDYLRKAEINKKLVTHAKQKNTNYIFGEVICSAYKNMTSYWPTIGQLKCILACQWEFSHECIGLLLVICIV